MIKSYRFAKYKIIVRIQDNEKMSVLDDSGFIILTETFEIKDMLKIKLNTLKIQICYIPKLGTPFIVPLVST